MKNKLFTPKIFVVAGVSLVICAAIVLAVWQGNIHLSKQKIETSINTLYTLMPTPQGAVLEERGDNTMPVLSVENTDFIGIIEMPKFISKLPVGASWGKPTKHPCYFDGSIYNSTLKVGATSQAGQYDFCGEISVGDTVLFTDMSGNQYTFYVTNLRYQKHADKAVLERENAALTLFIKNVYDFEYLIVSCDVK